MLICEVLLKNGMLLALFFIWNLLHFGIHWEQLISWDGLESFIKFNEGKITVSYSKNNPEIYYV